VRRATGTLDFFMIIFSPLGDALDQPGEVSLA
jgi:hypothetical protein